MCNQFFFFHRQESISIFLTWNFEFTSRYPRPIQSQFNKMRNASSLYQSMIESLVDFKVVLVLAGQLNRQIGQCLYEDKTSTNLQVGDSKEPKFFKANLYPASQLPWSLIGHLESNFVCPEIRVPKPAANSRVLPSVLTNTAERSISMPQDTQDDAKNDIENDIKAESKDDIKVRDDNQA